MIAQQDVRRRLDGSIDIDFYRQKGLMERRLAMTGFFKGTGRPLAAAVLALVALSVVAPRDGTAGANTAPTRTSISR